MLQNSSTAEQPARIHNTENANFVKLEKLTHIKAGNIYQIDGKTIEVTAKHTAYGSGKKTVYTGTADGKTFEKLDINQLQKMVLGQANTRTMKNNFTTKEETRQTAEKWSNNLIKTLDDICRVLGSYSDSSPLFPEVRREIIVRSYRHAYQEYAKERRTRKEQKANEKTAKIKADANKAKEVKSEQDAIEFLKAKGLDLAKIKELLG